MKRRILFFLYVLLQPVIHAQEKPFSFSTVQDMAEQNAALPYVTEKSETGMQPDLSYDQYRNIRFNPADAVWIYEKLPFRLELFPTGFYFRKKIQLNIVCNGVPSELTGRKDMFINTSGKPVSAGATVPLSGFRVRTPVNNKNIWDEFLVFQGASYFRAVPKNGWYGLSARGIVIHPSGSAPEEFPDFCRFWIIKPEEDSPFLEIYALLDGPSVTGAYSFIIRPGTETVMQVKAVIFARAPVHDPGIAPLTSMFLFDKSNHLRFDDFRTGVHDSDGLILGTGGGEEIWHQLSNPPQVQTSSFTSETPRFFGLIQRERDAASYQDFEAGYEKRPSAWIEPGTDWPVGSVDLVELPASEETEDNIVLFWNVKKDMIKGDSLTFSYTLHWSLAEPEEHTAKVIATRTGLLPGNREERIFVVDFSGNDLFPDDINKMNIELQTSAGSVKNQRLERNPLTHGVRLSFELLPGQNTMADLRARMLYKNNPMTET
jgi:periplasmic glucans biosynthesis protein